MGLSVATQAANAVHWEAEYSQFEWDGYTPEEQQNLRGWLFDNRNNQSLIEEVATEPWGRLLNVLRTGTHYVKEQQTAAASRRRARREDDRFVTSALSHYQVQETDNGQFGHVVLVGRPGQRALKLGRHRYKNQDGASRTAYTGVYNTVLAIIEDNPDNLWTPYRVAKALEGLGGNWGIKNSEARARSILQDLGARGYITVDGGCYRALGQDRMAVLRSERMIPQTVGGIMAAHATDARHLDQAGNVYFTTAEIGTELRAGGFIQGHEDITDKECQGIAQRALERLRRDHRAVTYDAQSDMWTMPRTKLAHMPAIAVEMA